MDNATALRDWLKREGRAHVWLARKLHVSPVTLSRWLAGVYTPNRHSRAHIDTLTGGAVPAEAWSPKGD